MPLSRAETLCLLAALALSLLAALAVALPPVIFDTLHLADTTFLAEAARWIHGGAVPGRDFDYFYGGIHAQFVAWAYGLTGVTIKALDIALLLEWAVLMGLLAALAWRRLDGFATAGLLLLLSVIVFARLPFEEYPQLLRFDAAHSFGYNRLGTALVVLGAVVVLVPGRTATAETLGAGIAGVTAMLALLTKWTFAPHLLACALGFALMGRWRGLLVYLIAAGLTLLAVDPGLHRLSGAYAYSMANAGVGEGVVWILRKSLRMMLAQQVQVLAALGILILCLIRGNRALIRPALAAVLILGGFWGTAVTMGPGGLVGHQGTPVIAGLAILLAFAADRAGAGARAPMAALAALLLAAVAVPQGLNTLGTAALSFRHAEKVAFHDGAYAGYLARDGHLRDEAGGIVTLAQDPQSAVAVAAAQLSAGLSGGQGGTINVDYVRLWDGLRLVGPLPEAATTTLVSDSLIHFGFALGTARPENYPIWPRIHAPEFAPGSDPLAGVDLVLLSTHDGEGLHGILRAAMGSDFTPCRRSPLWELHARPGRCPAG